MENTIIDLTIFHHHLMPGGVTDVIRHSISCLSYSERIRSIKVVCGRKENSEKMKSYMENLQDSGCLFDLEIVPELDYLSSETACGDDGLLKKLLLKRYASEDSVWLIHNYHLGKNWAFTKALNSIAQSSTQRIIYQIHDFPECARYGNLKELKTHIQGSLYPSSSNLKYCVINVRDYKILKKSGMNDNDIHLLENPVPAGNNPADLRVDKKKIISTLSKHKGNEGRLASDGSLWLYPVRSIRRKNVLEGGFLAALQEEPVNLILTLPGISAQEKSYSDLCERAFSMGLIQGFWGTGTLPDEVGITYQEMISGSDLIYSSSVQEGFGYMYLNALLWKKPLIARSLDIMEGFLPLMKDYPALFYKQILIPGNRELKTRVKRQYEDRFTEVQNYLSPQLRDKLNDELKVYLKGDSLEFSFLSPDDQYSILEKLASRAFFSECRDLNAPVLNQIKHLRNIEVRDKGKELYSFYGEESYREQFSRILNSFSDNSFFGIKSPEFSNENDPLKIDRNLSLEFSKLEYLRLLYR